MPSYIQYLPLRTCYRKEEYAKQATIRHKGRGFQLVCSWSFDDQQNNTVELIQQHTQKRA